MKLADLREGQTITARTASRDDATARTEPNRNRPQITRRLRAAGFLLLWLASMALTFNHRAIAFSLSCFSIAAFLWHYARTWRQNTEAFNRYFRRNAPPLTPPTAKISHGEATASPSAQDAPPQVCSMERSIANVLSTPHLWN